MFRYKYIPLLSVGIQHSYYKNLMSKDFDIPPLPSSQHLLRAYNLQAKRVEGQLFLYQQTDKDNQPVQEIDEVLNLFFTIRSKTDVLNVSQGFSHGTYLFSNLKTDGSYQQSLTSSSQHSAADLIDQIVGLRHRLSFTPNTISRINIKKIIPTTGLTTIESHDLEEEKNYLDLNLTAGRYEIEQELKTGGTKHQVVLAHPNISNNNKYLGVIHLQLAINFDQQPVNQRNFTLTLSPINSKWNYILLKPQQGPSEAIDGNLLALRYAIPEETRYPSVVNFELIPSTNYSTAMQTTIDSLKTDNRIKEIYVFESDQNLELLEDDPPIIKLVYNNETINPSMPIPSREMKHRNIFYNL